VQVHFTVPRSMRRASAPIWKSPPGALASASPRPSTSVFFSEIFVQSIAADMKGYPFRDRFGRLHFRPAGHGALLENLNDLQADLVYIKNIDNIVPDRLKEHVCHWKKVLGGYLVFIQQQIHEFVRRLKRGETGEVVREAARFAAGELLIEFPCGFDEWPRKRGALHWSRGSTADSRVCGVVTNAASREGRLSGRRPDGRQPSKSSKRPRWISARSGSAMIWNSSTTSIRGYRMLHSGLAKQALRSQEIR